jgi:hypothetical protein
MSKLIDAVQEHRTGRIYAKPPGPVCYSEMMEIEDRVHSLAPYLVEYRIDVSVGAIIRREEGDRSGDSTRHISRMIEQEVFGEFRADFDRIHRALYAYDYEAIRKAVGDMQARMFSA